MPSNNIEPGDFVKCVVVGDGMVGKTCLLLSYTTGHFPLHYDPTCFETYYASVIVKGNVTQIALFDTAGQEDFDSLRQFSYPDTDIFLLCFSLTDPKSLDNISDKWYLDVRKHRPKTPVILVGTKLDLRQDDSVSREMASAVAKRIKAVNYIECSAKTGENVKTVFDKAVTVGLMSKKSKNCQCCCNLM